MGAVLAPSWSDFRGPPVGPPKVRLPAATSRRSDFPVGLRSLLERALTHPLAARDLSWPRMWTARNLKSTVPVCFW